MSSRHINQLKRLFTITGNGVAHLNVDKALQDDQFKNAIHKLSKLKIPYKSNG